jgi:hypothetical protein
MTLLRSSPLALLAPATDFFRGPGALDAVHLHILAWAGQRDAITPPSQVEFLKDALAGRGPVQVRAIEDAGHFSFMDVLPPQAAESLPDRARLPGRAGRGDSCLRRRLTSPGTSSLHERCLLQESDGRGLD